jgi:transposase
MQLDEERQRTIRRCLAGEGPTTIAASLGRSRQWVYKWFARYRGGGETWATEASRWLQ